MGEQHGGDERPRVRGRGRAAHPAITPIEGWAVSAKVEPLRQDSGGVLALVFEEEVEAPALLPRAVVSFRGSVAGSMVDFCVQELLFKMEETVNASLVAWCLSTYSSSTLDYYSQALAYAQLALQSYDATRLLLSGSSMGGGLSVLAAAGLLADQNSIALPVVSFMTAQPLPGLTQHGLSLEGHYSSIITAAIEWDPVVRLFWDYEVGTLCLFPEQAEPQACVACYNSSSTVTSENDEACLQCRNLTHDSLLLLQLMLQGASPTCYLLEQQHNIKLFPPAHSLIR